MIPGIAILAALAACANPDEAAGGKAGAAQARAEPDYTTASRIPRRKADAAPAPAAAADELRAAGKPAETAK